MVYSPITRLRLVSRPGDADTPREIAPVDAKSGDVIEILDQPVYEVDPVTRTCQERLQQFTVRDGVILEVVEESALKQRVL